MNQLSAKLSELRNEYSSRSLTREEVKSHPLIQFEMWFNEALETEVREPNAFTLATVGEDNKPSARILLLKGISKGGFTFFTNYLSRKAKQIEKNPAGAMVFLWPELERQVRVEGTISKVTAEESSEYFIKRPLGSRLGAWASIQSSVVPDRNYLEEKMKELKDKYEGKSIERPDYWGGYRLVPTMVEFWQGRPNRLHDRIQYTKKEDSWEVVRLSP